MLTERQSGWGAVICESCYYDLTMVRSLPPRHAPCPNCAGSPSDDPMWDRLSDFLIPEACLPAIGSNGYAKELGFNPLDVLTEKDEERVAWLDLCCGSGKALIEAAQTVRDEGMDTKIEIVGVDLVARSSPPPPNLTCLRFIEGSRAAWQPSGKFDLITCVHGLHYVGDKLGLISRAASWLKDESQFVANLDIKNIRLTDGRSASRVIPRELRRNGVDYDSRKKLLCCPRRVQVRLPFRYLGADDQVGPNYTKQPAVDSYYERLDEQRASE